MVEGSILTGFWTAGITRRLEGHDLLYRSALILPSISMLSLYEASPGSCLPLSTFDTRRAMERPTASGHSQHTDWERLTVCERVASSGGAWVAGWASRPPPSQAGGVSSPRVTVGGGVRRPGGRAAAPARRGASGPRRALRPRPHLAVVPCAALLPRPQAMPRTGDRPLGEAGFQV